MRKITKRNVAVVTVLTAISAGSFLYLKSRPDEQTVSALKAYDCAVDPSMGCLFDFLAPEEISKCGLTRENVKVIQKEFIAPSVNSWKPNGKVVTQKLTNQVVATQPLMSPTGIDGQFIVDVTDSNGKQITNLSVLLHTALALKMVRLEDKKLPYSELNLKVAAEFERITPRLKDLGIKGLYRSTGKVRDDGFVSLEDLPTKMRASSAVMKKQNQ